MGIPIGMMYGFNFYRTFIDVHLGASEVSIGLPVMPRVVSKISSESEIYQLPGVRKAKVVHKIGSRITADCANTFSRSGYAVARGQVSQRSAK